MKLLVEMGEFSAGVLEEEFAVQCEGEREDIDKENRTVDQDWRAIEPEQDALIGNEVGKRLHTPEAKSQNDGVGRNGCVANNRASLEALVPRKYVIARPNGLIGISSFGTLLLKTNTK